MGFRNGPRYTNKEEKSEVVAKAIENRLSQVSTPKPIIEEVAKAVAEALRTQNVKDIELEDSFEITDLMSEVLDTDLAEMGIKVIYSYRAQYLRSYRFSDPDLGLETGTQVLTVDDRIDERTYEEISSAVYGLRVKAEFRTSINSDASLGDELRENGIAIDSKGGTIYKLIQINKDNFKASDMLWNQLKQEGKENAWLGYNSFKNGTALCFEMEELPVFGDAERYNTGCFKEDREEAIKYAEWAYRTI